MHRHPLGRGRLIAGLSAIAILAACLLPWYGVGGGVDLPARDLRAFDGSGFLAFLAALGTLAILALPYAAGDRPVGADRWLSYLLLFGLGAIGIVLWPIGLLGDYPAGLLPDRAPGLWLAAIGLVGLARATFEIAREPPRR